MKKLALGLCVLAILGSAGEIAGASRRPRVVSGDYLVVRDRPTVLPTGTGSGAKVAAFVSFPSRPRERYVDVEVRDDSGLDVAAEVLQDLDDDGVYEISSSICGTSMWPVPVIGGYDVVIALREGPCSNESAVPVKGTVTIGFRRDRRV